MADHHHHHHDMDHSQHQQTTMDPETTSGGMPGYHVVHDHASHDHSSHGAGPHDSIHQHDQHQHDHHQVFFNTNYNVTVMFQHLVMDSRSSVFLVCLFTFILSVGYQGTKWLRQYLHANYRDRIHSIKSREHVLQTALYGMEFLVSYLLMLIVMTYNAWVFAVTILGIGFGYFLIGWHRNYGSACAADCPNVTDFNKDCEGNVLPQELVPLDSGGEGGGVGGCEGCRPLFDSDTGKETDVLT